MYAQGLTCVGCQKIYPLDPLYECENCGGILEVYYDFGCLKMDGYAPASGKANENLMPIHRDKRISLGEGDTPLVKADRLANRLGLQELFLKCEFSNPTGSFKDRPVSIGMSMGLKFGYKRVVVASSGNGAASTAAYAARAGLDALILVPEFTPAEKVAQTLAYGARVVRVKGPYSNCFALARAVSLQYEIFNLTTTFINPYTVEGDKSVAFELFAQMAPQIPHFIYVPIGAGPLLAGIYKGYKELLNLHRIALAPPKMAGIQAEGCNTIAKAFMMGETEVKPEKNPHTIASGLADGLDGYSKDGTYTLKLIKESGGFSLAVADSEIKEAMGWLSKDEGIFVEPSAAAGIAGLAKSIDAGIVERHNTIVAVLTGHGLKDMSQIQTDTEIPTVTGSLDELLEVLKSELEEVADN